MMRVTYISQNFINFGPLAVQIRMRVFFINTEVTDHNCHIFIKCIFMCLA